MPRYDADWRRPSYDRSFQPPRPRRGGGAWGGGGWGGGGEGGESAGLRGGQGRGYDAGYAREEEFSPAGGIYGPARYGLGPYHQRLRQRRRPDEELKQEVEEALFLDTWVDAEAITVEVEEGIVTLRGELPDYDEVRYAVDDAWDVEGVRGVRSELTVRAD